MRDALLAAIATGKLSTGATVPTAATNPLPGEGASSGPGATPSPSPQSDELRGLVERVLDSCTIYANYFSRPYTNDRDTLWAVDGQKLDDLRQFLARSEHKGAG
jgi:hypothetical protein